MVERAGEHTRGGQESRAAALDRVDDDLTAAALRSSPRPCDREARETRQAVTGLSGGGGRGRPAERLSAGERTSDAEPQLGAGAADRSSDTAGPREANPPESDARVSGGSASESSDPVPVPESSDHGPPEPTESAVPGPAKAESATPGPSEPPGSVSVDVDGAAGEPGPAVCADAPVEHDESHEGGDRAGDGGTVPGSSGDFGHFEQPAARETPRTPPENLDRPLPEDVRRRVVAIAADAFGSLTVAELPGPLRQYARFTPARRAKFAATALASALESDLAFRQRMAARLRQTQPELSAALDAGTVPAAAEPLEIAAAAYLLRPAGWTGLVTAAGDEVTKVQAERAREEVARELRKVKAELAELRSSSRTESDRARAEVEAARREADALQRKVRSAVNDMRRAEAALRKVEAELESVRSAAAAERAQAESEARRLRTRLAEAESAVEAGRRAAREGRSIEDMRLRLLLDTVLDAAQGLRRELALPPTTGRPADTVEAVAPGQMTPKDIARRALAEDDPALLDQLLALPQAHLVVDGYNVTKTGYPTMPLEKQRLRLLGGLAALAAQSGAEVTCVFDGADLEAPVLLAPPRGVRVLFSKAGETADELIRRLARAEPPGRPVVVVSADREVADGVRRTGARPVASTLLLKRLARG